MIPISSAAAVVLAGGRGTRMGRDKNMIEIAGRPLIAHVVGRAREVFAEVIIAGPAALAAAGARAVPDRRPGLGPLEGLRSGLINTAAPWLFALPCDSPFVPETFLRGMAGLAAEEKTGLVIVPRPGEFLEPLHALYSRQCLPHIERLIEAGERKAIKLYDLVPIREIGPDMLRQWDPEGLAFFNLNTPSDLERAGEIHARHKA